MNKKYTHCAMCRGELDDCFFTFSDEYIQRHYFDEPDGSDNAFCSNACAAMAVRLEEFENVREEE